ncbi:hypothetical protein C427_5544 [Paraglaciecola psychrophila 170]|uniref:Uncharacterized protein n=1 Tax=Paraglaciecola psychrophila 170 TaxID=1129794 RepID=M4RY96_9ALTE|nr:hypothetical protein C427_5544 [Paraglaciecola psychrophila 170]
MMSSANALILEISEQTIITDKIDLLNLVIIVPFTISSFM